MNIFIHENFPIYGTFISAISSIEETCQLRKVIVKAKFVNQYKHAIKGTGIKVSCFVSFFHPVEKDLLIGKVYSNEEVF